MMASTQRLAQYAAVNLEQRSEMFSFEEKLKVNFQGMARPFSETNPVTYLTSM